MSARALALALAVSAAAIVGCNAITGAGEPEIVGGEGGGGTTTATTGGPTGSAGGDPGPGGAGPGGGGPAGAGGAGGQEDDDPPGDDVPRCGDGARDPAEACDDGGQEDGDGCSASCELECSDLEVAHDATGRCVFFSPEDDDRSWDDARAACQSESGDLLVLHDLDLALLGGRLEGLAHVGATRAEDGAFEWIDGETVDEAAVSGAGDCLAVGGGDGAWALVAVACSARHRFLCERDPTSAP